MARLAEVSPKTVSRVLNNEPNVREITKVKVLAVAQSLGYKPNMAARSLAGSRSFLIAHIYDNPNMDYIARANAGIFKSCHEQGYYLLPEPVDATSADLVPNVAVFLERSRVECVVLTPPLSDHAGLHDMLREKRVRFVAISPERRRASVSSVWMEDQAAAIVMVQHLLELGHKEIGFIAGPVSHGAAARRESGYCDALAEAGIERDTRLTERGDFSFRSGLDAGHGLLTRNARLTAIFAANDDMAAGAMAAAMRAGRVVPDDISVAGFDAAQIGAALWPPLTTIRQPISTMAEDAARWLMGDSPSAGEDVLQKSFAFELVIRASTGRA